jgi:biopolymer transport protein ExbB
MTTLSPRLRVLAALLCFGALAIGTLHVHPLQAQDGADAAKSAAPADPDPPTKEVKNPNTVWNIVFGGNLVGCVIMCSLFALSFIGAYLFFDHLLSIRRPLLVPDELDDRVRALLIDGKVREAESACQSTPSVLSAILSAGLLEVDGGWSAVEKAIEDSMAEQSARLFRKLEFMSVIGNIAPMLGLLGTVTGMLFAFYEIAQQKGTAGAADLAVGIYQALVTTVVGLIIAIPALGAFAYFRNRIDQFLAEAAAAANHAFTPLRKKKSATFRKEGMPPSIPASTPPRERT